MKERIIMSECLRARKKIVTWTRVGCFRNKLIASHLILAILVIATFAAVTEYGTVAGAATMYPPDWPKGVLITLMLSAAAAIAISFVVAASWTRQTSSITGALTSLVSANRLTKADVVTNDELGDIAETWNAICEELTGTTAMSPQDQQILQAIVEASGEAQWVASHGPTGHSTRANVVESSPNQAAHDTPGQLQEVASNVQDAALAMSSSAHEIRSATENLSKETETYVTQIIDTSSAVSEMVESIREVADNTSKSAAVAEEARQNTKKGSHAVADTIRGMDRIRTRVQATSKRIKQLGESSQQIGEIVQLISDVADRTSILAMNATIQAGMAGDAGKGFAVVGEEVERLAKRCNRAIKEITEIVRGIQSESAEAISAMEDSIVEVVNGSKLASQAGEALADIDSVSEKLTELINSISLSAKQQARGGLLVSRSVKEMSDFMQATATGTRQAAVSVGQLATLADSLRVSADKFNLSGKETSRTAPIAIEGTPDSQGMNA
jgi:methyl-accepting chemotaxis protein